MQELALTGEDIVELILDRAPARGRILEVGCACGDIAIMLLERMENTVYGIDVSRHAISEARSRSQHLSNIFFEVGNAEALDFPDGFFDLVYCVRTLHETEAARSLNEMYRALMPGGILMIIDWTKEAAARWSERSFDFEELKNMLSQTGFTHLSLETRNDFYVMIARK